MDVPGDADGVTTATVRCVYEGGALIVEPDVNFGAWYWRVWNLKVVAEMHMDLSRLVKIEKSHGPDEERIPLVTKFLSPPACSKLLTMTCVNKPLCGFSQVIPILAR
jgi:hypothetical protein